MQKPSTFAVLTVLVLFSLGCNTRQMIQYHCLVHMGQKLQKQQKCFEEAILLAKKIPKTKEEQLHREMAARHYMGMVNYYNERVQQYRSLQAERPWLTEYPEIPELPTFEPLHPGILGVLEGKDGIL